MEEQTNIQTEPVTLEEGGEVMAGPKPSKIFLLIAIAVVAIALIVGAIFLIMHLSTHPIDRFYEKLSNAESFTMKMVVSVQEGNMSMTMTANFKRDGDLAYVSMKMADYMDSETYYEFTENITYQYVKENGQWVKSVFNDENDPTATSNEIFAILDPENYDEVKGEAGTYRQKRNVSFETFEDVLLIIDGDELVIEATMSSVPNCKITFTEINSTNLTLPKSGS